MTGRGYGSWRPEFRTSSLIVGWNEDAGKLGDRVTEFLIRFLSARYLVEIDPSDFFNMGGVTIEDDLVQFPESKLYASPQHDLVVFKSSRPAMECYNFFNQLLDITENLCNTREIYIIGGMTSLSAHTAPRPLLGVFNSLSLKKKLARCEIQSEVTFETPPGQKPTLNSFLLWAARKRNLPGVDLWTPIPFYLMSVDDPEAQKRVLEFFNQRFKLGMDLQIFDESIKRQNMFLSEARIEYPDIDSSILRLESNLMLPQDENLKLEKQIGEYLKSRNNS